jgi:hypothetical protein
MSSFIPPEFDPWTLSEDALDGRYICSGTLVGSVWDWSVESLDEPCVAVLAVAVESEDVKSLIVRI